MYEILPSSRRVFDVNATKLPGALESIPRGIFMVAAANFLRGGACVSVSRVSGPRPNLFGFISSHVLQPTSQTSILHGICSDPTRIPNGPSSPFQNPNRAFSKRKGTPPPEAGRGTSPAASWEPASSLFLRSGTLPPLTDLRRGNVISCRWGERGGGVPGSSPYPAINFFGNRRLYLPPGGGHSQASF